MTGKTLIIFPRGQLDAKQKERLTKHDVIAIEADDPKSVQVIPQSNHLNFSSITGDAFVLAAIDALADVDTDGASRQRQMFLQALKKYMKKD